MKSGTSTIPQQPNCDAPQRLEVIEEYGAKTLTTEVIEPAQSD